MSIKDLTNQRFGSLTAIRFDNIGKGRSAYWIYRCDCGKEIGI